MYLYKHSNAIHEFQCCSRGKCQFCPRGNLQIVSDRIFARGQIIILENSSTNHKRLTGLPKTTKELLEECQGRGTLIANGRIWIDLWKMKIKQYLFEIYFNIGQGISNELVKNSVHKILGLRIAPIILSSINSFCMFH
jgi:hypothetical protein